MTGVEGGVQYVVGDSRGESRCRGSGKGTMRQ